MAISKTRFGSTPAGQPVDLYVLSNSSGIVAKAMNYGGILTELHVPDRHGQVADIVLGFDNLAQYLGKHPHFGAITGRFANRIAKGRFTLDGMPYTLATNNGPNHLHGGPNGFDKKWWQGEEFSTSSSVGVRLRYTSANGEEGYPGNLKCTVTYTLTDQNELCIEYEATTDRPTPINLTNHSYFNLAGAGSGDVLNHELKLNADRYTPVDETLIPTGEIASVRETPLDFTKPALIGSRIAQVKGGYDHNFVLNAGGGALSLAAIAHESSSGRIMEVHTTQPGVQLYTGNFLDGTLHGNGGVYGKHAGFCLETQHFPDSVNRPNFPSTILRPGETYRQMTTHRFAAS